MHSLIHPSFQALEQERKKRELFSDIIDIAKPQKTTPKVETTTAPPSPSKPQKAKEEIFDIPSKTEKQPIPAKSAAVDEEEQMEAMKRELKKGKKKKKKVPAEEEDETESVREAEDSPPPAKKAKKKKKAKSYLDDL